MKYSYTILFADNLPEQVASRIRLLESYGYRVLPALTLQAAEKIMLEEHVHLAILDIRMIDEDDEKDVSGLSLAKDSRFRSIPKIVYTGYSTLETMRTALKYPLVGMPDAVDYLVKLSSDEVFLTAIQTACSQVVHLNEGLVITNLKTAKSIASLVNDFESGLERARVSARIDEMEDLFRKLFYESQQITISNVFWTTSERFALEVLAYKDGSEERFVLVGGKADTILNEIKTYEKRVPRAHKIASLASFKSAEAVNYAIRAIPIPPVENFASEIKTLAGFYQNHSLAQTKEVLSDLFGNILSLWRLREAEVKEIAMAEHYRRRLGLLPEQIPPEQFRALLSKLNRECIVRNIAEFMLGPDTWSVSIQKGPVIELGNPLLLLYAPALSPGPVRFNLCAGYLSVETILVDQKKSAMLTDYAGVAQAPIWDDFVTLEHSARMLNVRSDLQSLLAVEKSLLSVNRLGENCSLEDVDGELKRGAGVLQLIRQQAANLKEFGLTDYLVALYFYTIRDLASYPGESTLPTPHLKKFAYQLALVGMISAKLAELFKSSRRPFEDSLSPAPLAILDPISHQVLVGERGVDLSPQEFALFQYLFENAGKVCPRTEILREVYGLSRPSESDEGLLTQNISRLRKKIETNPIQPAYLQTVQGVGYKLVTHSH
jgi:DNA-binding response OmpR family regulator